jgi:hypothetical protein
MRVIALVLLKRRAISSSVGVAFRAKQHSRVAFAE